MKANNQRLLDRAYSPLVVYLLQIHRHGRQPWNNFEVGLEGAIFETFSLNEAEPNEGQRFAE